MIPTGASYKFDFLVQLTVFIFRNNFPKIPRAKPDPETAGFLSVPSAGGRTGSLWYPSGSINHSGDLMPAAGAIGLSHQLYCIYLVFHLFIARYFVWLFFVKRFLVRLFYPNLCSREQCCLPTTGLIKISLLVVIINMYTNSALNETRFLSIHTIYIIL